MHRPWRSGLLLSNRKRRSALFGNETDQSELFELVGGFAKGKNEAVWVLPDYQNWGR
jgi:hypothetical protein